MDRDRDRDRNKRNWEREPGRERRKIKAQDQRLKVKSGKVVSQKWSLAPLRSFALTFGSDVLNPESLN